MTNIKPLSFSEHKQDRKGLMVLFVSLVLLAISPYSLHSQSTWSGAGGSELWSKNNNWNTPPTGNGESLVFGTSHSSGTTLTDDLANPSASFNTITFNAGAPIYTIGGNDFTLTGGITNSSMNSQTLSNNITLGSATTFNTATGGGNLLLSGNLSGATTDTLTLTGGGNLTLSGTANTYSGTITQNSGILTLSSVLGSGATINKQAGAAINLNTDYNTPITINSYGGYAGTADQGADIYSYSSQGLSSSGVINLESGTTTSLWIGGYSFKYLIKGPGAMQVGTSTQTSNAAPVDYTAITNTGGLTIQSSASNSSTLTMDGTAATIASAPGTPNLTFSSKGASTTLGFKNTSAATLPTLQTAAGTSGSQAILQGSSTANTILSIGNNNGSGNFAGIVQNSGTYTTGINKVGTGTQTLSGDNTYTGTTTVSAGTLQAGIANDAFGSNSAVTTANTAGATLDLNGNNETIGSLAGGGTTGGNVTLGAGTLTTGALNTNTSFGGVISGSGGLIKKGTGTQALTNANTYTGATAVKAGTLLVNNNLASATTVSSGAALGGSGTLAGMVTMSSGAIISMGSAATSTSAGGTGNLTLNGGLTESGTSALNFTVGSTSNTLSINGAVNIAGILDIYLADSGGLSGNQTITLIHSSITALTLSEFNLETASLPSSITDASLELNGNNLDLSYTVVPEPPTWTLIGLGALLLAGLKLQLANVKRRPPRSQTKLRIAEFYTRAVVPPALYNPFTLSESKNPVLS